MNEKYSASSWTRASRRIPPGQAGNRRSARRAARRRSPCCGSCATSERRPAAGRRWPTGKRRTVRRQPAGRGGRRRPWAGEGTRSTNPIAPARISHPRVPQFEQVSYGNSHPHVRGPRAADRAARPGPAYRRKVLKPTDKAYRKHGTSLRQFGLVELLIWNERTGHVVGGHARLAILKSMGVTEVPVSVLNLTDAREKALVQQPGGSEPVRPVSPGRPAGRASANGRSRRRRASTLGHRRCDSTRGRRCRLWRRSATG